MRASMRPSLLNVVREFGIDALGIESRVEHEVVVAEHLAARALAVLQAAAGRTHVRTGRARHCRPAAAGHRARSRRAAATAGGPRARAGTAPAGVSGSAWPRTSRPRRGQSALAHSEPPPLEARQLLLSAPLRPSQRKRAACCRRHDAPLAGASCNDASAPSQVVAALAGIARQRQRADVAARFALQLQRFHRAARIERQRRQRQADVEAAGAHRDRAVAALPRQPALRAERCRRGNRRTSGRCR